MKIEEVQELTRRMKQFDTETGVARLFTIVAEQIIQQHPDLKSLDSDDAVLESTRLCTLWETVKKGLSAEGVRARSSLRVEPEMSRSQDPKRLSEAGLNTSLTASDLNGPSVQPDGASYHAADRDPSVIAEDEPQSREDFHLSHGLQQYTRCMHHGCGKCAKGEHRVAFT